MKRSVAVGVGGTAAAGLRSGAEGSISTPLKKISRKEIERGEKSVAVELGHKLEASRIGTIQPGVRFRWRSRSRSCHDGADCDERPRILALRDFEAMQGRRAPVDEASMEKYLMKRYGLFLRCSLGRPHSAENQGMGKMDRKRSTFDPDPATNDTLPS